MASQNSMKAWRLAGPGGALTLQDVPIPMVRPGTVLVQIEATPVLTYLKEYVQGKLQGYTYPSSPFTPGTNGVGRIASVGADVWHFRAGQRVILSPYILAPNAFAFARKCIDT